ncbi:MAG: flavin reductase [Sphingobium sp.]|nr:MAG: flavin reductase [Sphingobium sp.]
MARLGAAVNVITTDGPAGRHGLTVSAVCSVSDSPPTLLVCVNRTARSNAQLKANGVLCVNVLAGHHEELSGRFAGRGTDPQDRFRADDGWLKLATGSPVLPDAAVALDCRIATISEVGSHSVLFCEVVAMHLGAPSDGLVYFDRCYHRLPTRQAA